NKAFGSRSINLVVLKKEKADAIKLVDDIKGIVSGFTKDKSGLKVSLIDDLSFYIKRRLNILRNNGWVGMILVCLALFAFLSRGAAIMTAMGIPIAFMLTFIVMSFTGMTINLITMFGLVMILGLVVDDGIIISENVYRYIEKGLTPKEAAIKGTSEVIKPVTVTVLTTIVAFTPLLFMSGLIGKFIRGIPTVAIIALFASMLEAFFILPCHLADFAARRKSHSSDGQHKKRSAWFDKLLSGYSGILAAAVKRRYALAAALVSVLILSLLLAVFGMKFVLFPSRGIEQFYVRAEAPLGTSLYRTNELLAPLEEMLASLPKNELDAFTGEAGVMRLDRFAGPTSRFGSHLAQVTVYLTPERGRKRTASMIIDDLREKVKDIEGFDKIYFEREHSGPPVGKPVEVTVRGEKFDVLNGIADKIRWFLGGVKGVNDILSDYEWGKEEIRVIVDNDAAASTYLSVGDIASSVRNAFDGGIATTIKREKAEEEIAVLVRFPIERKDDISAFEKILIPNRFGNLIPLNKVARIEKEKSISYINHLDGKRAVTVTAEVDEKYTTSAVVNKKIYSKFKDISLENLGYTLKIGGEGEETKKSMRSLLKAFAMAFLLIFLILATNFRSLIQPLVIMLAIPFGLIGVVFGFFIHHEPLSFMAIMGIVGLNGVVVNDSIVLVDFINRLRAEGVDRRESILKAGAIRLRPVLLTTITTVGGLSTVAYGIGGRDPFLVPMALSIVWGLIFATALTLIALPCIYAIVDDVSLKFRHKSIFNPAKT
ncbi:MAG: hypothetical protein AUJ75_00555, partial [Candidatus Omnitrophica bacterium CG1_02_49_10]